MSCARTCATTPSATTDPAARSSSSPPAPGTAIVPLTVKDNGIGIPKDAQSSVFERFYRVDKSRSKATGGTGLGLAIVKHIARIHNARIKLESEVNVGTTITVVFETAH